MFNYLVFLLNISIFWLSKHFTCYNIECIFHLCCISNVLNMFDIVWSFKALFSTKLMNCSHICLCANSHSRLKITFDGYAAVSFKAFFIIKMLYVLYKWNKLKTIDWWYPCVLQNYCKFALDGKWNKYTVEIKLKKIIILLHMCIVGSNPITYMW